MRLINNREIHFGEKRICKISAAVIATKSLALILATAGIFSFAGCKGSDNSEAEVPKESESQYKDTPWTVADGYIKASEAVSDIGSDESKNPVQNTEYTLSVPTYINKIGDDWFIVDCYHNQVIYSDNLTTPLNEWKVLTKDANQPHTMAGDGTVFLVDDTENNRVLVFEIRGAVYVNTQVFNDIGKRPHYTVYDEEDKAFYVWSSTTGEMYIFRREADSAKLYLTEIRKVESLDGTYIRSFYMDGNDIYFVSGITAKGSASGIIKCDKYTFEIKEQIPVADALAGMASMRYDAPYYYITVSTDVTGSQDAATMLRTKDLAGLSSGDYEIIYDKYFVGGGTPYNIFEVDGTRYLTEHRLPGHAIWSYKIDENGEISDVNTVF